MPPEEVLASKRIFQSLDGDTDGWINKVAVPHSLPPTQLRPQEILGRTQLWQRLPCHSLVERENAPNVLIKKLGTNAHGQSNLGHWLALMELIWSK